MGRGKLDPDEETSGKIEQKLTRLRSEMTQELQLKYGNATGRC